MISIWRVSKFKADYKRCLKRGCDMNMLHAIIESLADGKKLDARYKDHSLQGEYKDCRECHIQPDWLLIYMLTSSELVLVRAGTHSDLFD
ncbi:MAG: type II toxin-antitoxin system YafQ family toxin [Bacteroidota bacterium]